MNRLRTSLVAAVFLLLATTAFTSCGKDSAEAKNCRKTSGDKVTLVASNVAWDASCIDATVGTLNFTVVNKDDVQHNLRVTGNGVNEHTPLQNGPVTQHLSVPLQMGTYTYVCDIHANMEGKLYVK
jgi:plastocyanin